MSVWPNRLRELREARSIEAGRKLLLEDVATSCGCSIGNLSRIEKGYVKPGASLLQALAAFYEVPADSLSVDIPGGRRVGDTHVIGAYVRQRRNDERRSLADYARRIEKASGSSVSVSLMRLIESGRRRFASGDAITDALVALLKEPSLDALRMKAFEMFEVGGLADVLEKLNGERVAHTKVIPLFIDSRPDELDVPTPPSLLRYVAPDQPEYAVRLDRPVFGPTLPAGTYFLARRGLPLSGSGFAVVWQSSEPKVVRLFADAELGLIGLRERPRMQIDMKGVKADPVLALIMPD